MISDQKKWMERVNPLIGLSLKQAQAIYDCARGNGSPLLQRIYAEIEAVDPVLMTCVERRGSALTGLGWRAVTREGLGEEDGALADEQRDAIGRMCEAIGNLDAAIEHMDQAFFRGYAHVQPIWEEDGTVKEIQLLDSWNFFRGPGKKWYWNPDCKMSPEGLQDCDDAGLVSVSRPRAIDYPAMSIYIRQMLGERDWGRYLERHALPKPAVTMHAGATEAQRVDYVRAAEEAEDGRPSIWPNGATITDYAGASRGQDPFSAFVAHQEKLIVLLATGGTLTSLAEAGSGTLAGNAHMDVWREIVARDAEIVGAAFNAMMVKPYLQRVFPGRPVVASFELGKDAEPDAGEMLDFNAKAYAGGFRIRQDVLEEKTGYMLEPVSMGSSGDGYGSYGGYPLQNVHVPLQNARTASEEPLHGSGKTPAGAILDAFAEDMKPATDAVGKLIRGGLDPADAKRLAATLRGMLPRESQTADLIETEMAETVAQAGAKDGAERK